METGGEKMEISEKTESGKNSSVLLVEPFYGGSHRQLMDLLESKFVGCVKCTMPAKKWHWRARTAALYMAENIPTDQPYRLLMCSSVLNLAELVALRPDLSSLTKVVYFHENQLIYPVRKQQDRDFQYGYNQILTCMVADIVVFNSQYNMESFLTSINTFMKTMPDHRPKGLGDKIRSKCRVIYFPINFTSIPCANNENRQAVTNDNSANETTQSDNTENVNTGKESIASNCDIHQPKQLAKETKHGEDSQDIKERNTQLVSDSKESSSAANVSPETMRDTSSCVKESGDQEMTEDNEKQQCDSGHPEKKRKSNSESEDHDEGSSDQSQNRSTHRPLHIVWPHRWEHDKAPEVFFESLLQLSKEGLDFKVSVLGETFTDVPDIFTRARSELASHVVQWGYLPSKADYYQCLRQADVVVSTARHEFFGVAMLEAVYCGCYPLCPNRLVYPEIFPAGHLYNTDNQLTKRLRQFCTKPHLVRNKQIQIELHKYSWETLSKEYQELLGIS